MLRKLIIICIFAWHIPTYSFVNKWSLIGHGGFSNPSVEYAEKSIDVTTKIFGGGGGNLQFHKHAGLEIEAVRFVYTKEGEPECKLGTQEIIYQERYKTSMVDFMFKAIWPVKNNTLKFYGKVGPWWLRSWIMPEDVSNSSEGRMPPVPRRGYGIGIGAGVNWAFAPRSFPNWSVDFSGVYYIPTAIAFLGENHVKQGFPVVKLGANYYCW